MPSGRYTRVTVASPASCKWVEMGYTTNLTNFLYFTVITATNCWRSGVAWDSIPSPRVFLSYREDKTETFTAFFEKLLKVARSGESARPWLRRASRELACFYEWQGEIAWAPRSVGVVCAPNNVRPDAYSATLSARTDRVRIQYFSDESQWESWLAATPLMVGTDAFFDAFDGSVWGDAHPSTKQRRSAAEEAVAPLRVLSTLDLQFALAFHGPVRLVESVIARYRALTRGMRASGGKNSVLRGFSAFKRLAACIRFTAGFFGTHKTDARNNS